MDFSQVKIMLLFLKGCFIGFFMAVPLGPVAFLAIQKTLQKKMYTAWTACLGASLADGLLALIASYSVGFFFNLLNLYATFFQLACAFVLMGMGIYLLFHGVTSNQEKWKVFAIPSIFLASFSLTFFNPLTLVTFTAIFAALHVTNAHIAWTSALVMGVVTGALAWWGSLIMMTEKHSKKIAFAKIEKIHHYLAYIIFGFGVVLLIKLFWRWLF